MRHHLILLVALPSDKMIDKDPSRCVISCCDNVAIVCDVTPGSDKGARWDIQMGFGSLQGWSLFLSTIYNLTSLKSSPSRPYLVYRFSWPFPFLRCWGYARGLSPTPYVNFRDLTSRLKLPTKVIQVERVCCK